MAFKLKQGQIIDVSKYKFVFEYLWTNEEKK